MTNIADSPTRNPSRLGLYAPFLLLGLAIVVWSVAWMWLKGEAVRRLDAGVAGLRARGWQVAWTERRIGGYPFRLDVDFAGLTLAEPSGWGLATPRLKTEAEAFAPTHWIVVAPAGAVVTGPGDGPVNIAARVLRFSVSGWDQRPPRISAEGADLTFTPAPGARPFALTAAQGIQIDTRAGPNDQGALFFSLDRATARPDSLLGRLVGVAPLDLKAEATFSHAGQVRGADWPSAVRSWSDAGGAFTVRQMTVQADGTMLDSRAGALAVDDSGRLAGSILANLGPTARGPQVTIGFRDGRISLDGVELGHSPRVF